MEVTKSTVLCAALVNLEDYGNTLFINPLNLLVVKGITLAMW